MLNAGANSGFGSFGLVIDFDPATDAVIGVHNYYGDPAYGGATALGNPQAGSGAKTHRPASGFPKAQGRGTRGRQH